MRTANPDLGFIDAELKIAVLLLDGARRTHGRSPSAENTRALERAWDEIDRLLDHRLLVSR
jgi:hypothetical protein